MKLRLHFWLILVCLLVPVTLLSQTNSLKSFLKELNSEPLSIEQIRNINIASGKTVNEKQEQLILNKVSTGNYKVDSVRYSMENGDKYHEFYNYENGNIVSYYNQLFEDGHWVNKERRLFDYDENGCMILMQKELYDSTRWVSFAKIESQYDENERLIKQTSYMFGENEWSEILMYEQGYDSNGNMIRLHEEMYLGSFKFVTDIEREFNSDNLLVKEEQENNSFNGSINYLRKTYTYDDNKNLVSLLEESKSDDKWITEQLITNEYGETGNQLSELVKRPNENDSLLINYRKTVYEYNQSDSVSTKTNFNWDKINGQWSNYYRYLYEYDLNGNITLEQRQKPDSTGEWIDYTRNKYNYNNEGYFVYGTSEEWSENTWIPCDGRFTFADIKDDDMNFTFRAAKIEQVYYSAVTGVSYGKEIVKNYSLSQNYPNPFNPTTSIEYQVTGNENVTLKVYDVLGKEVASLVNEQKSAGTYKVQFDAANLSSGVYFYKLETGNFTSVKKLILMK